jgi:hypothetical protein
VKNLTIASGSAASGGGIENRGSTLTMTDSTFSNNSAVGSNSSGIIDCENACYGGGIENDGGTLTVTNSTFSGNSAGFVGGGISNGGTLTVNYSTFSNNGAGVGGGIGNAIRNTATLSNTVLAGSQGGNCGLGTFIDGGYNISSDASCALTDSTSKNSTEPKLDPNGLQNNGGPHPNRSASANQPRGQRHPAEHQRLRHRHHDRPAGREQAPRSGL